MQLWRLRGGKRVRKFRGRCVAPTAVVAEIFKLFHGGFEEANIIIDEGLKVGLGI